MKNIITSISLATKIWFRTALVFGVGTFFYLIFTETFSVYHFMAFIGGTIAALIGSMPVLISLFILLPFFQRVNYNWQKKFMLIIGYIFFVTLCYGILAAFVNVGIVSFYDSSEYRFFTDLAFVTLALFACSSVSIYTCLNDVVNFLSNGEVNTINDFNFFQQLIYKQKSTTMDNQTNDQQPTESNYNEAYRKQFDQKTNNQSNSILIKGIITGVLILVMLIPTFFINNLITERQTLQQEVVKEVSSKWANAQTVTAPFITVPYSELITNSEGKSENVKRNLIIIADKLETKGNIFPEVRKRSIYKVLLYRSELKFAGNFKANWPKDINTANVDFANAKICFALSDYKGIEDEMMINFNNQKIALSQGLPVSDFGEIGVSAPIVLTAENLNAGVNFDMQVKIKGSEQLHFLPLASSSKYNVISNWKNPSFDGSSLPYEHNVNDSGFTALWNFSSVNLPFGSVTREKAIKINDTAFGVTLVQPADQYSKTTRSVKYAILLIGLSFALFFIVELLQKKPLHPVQYVLVGLALVIFYTLLLSIGEYIVFDFAYLTAALATISLITLYAKSHFDSWKSASIFAALLSCLYAFVFILIRLEDAALLVGSIGLFIILALVMYSSRKINWYGK